MSPLVESILAPAFLPRSQINHRLLLAISELNLSAPLARNGSEGAIPGYLITYLDDDTLIGRQLAGGGGSFVFTRDEDLDPKEVLG